MTLNNIINIKIKGYIKNIGKVYFNIEYSLYFILATIKTIKSIINLNRIKNKAIS